MLIALGWLAAVPQATSWDAERSSGIPVCSCASRTLPCSSIGVGPLFSLTAGLNLYCACFVEWSLCRDYFSLYYFLLFYNKLLVFILSYVSTVWRISITVSRIQTSSQSDINWYFRLQPSTPSIWITAYSPALVFIVLWSQAQTSPGAQWCLMSRCLCEVFLSRCLKSKGLPPVLLSMEGILLTEPLARETQDSDGDAPVQSEKQISLFASMRGRSSFSNC